MKARDFLLKHFGRYFKTCPRTGRITGIEPPGKLSLLFFPLIGILSIAWFLIRTVPNPYRAQYPCQKIALGIGVSFLTFLAGAVSSLALFRKLKSLVRNLKRPSVAILFAAMSLAFGFLTVSVLDSIAVHPKAVYADWQPTDPPNSPMGIAKGIFPGRVTWAHNGDATADTVSGSWWQPGNTDQAVVQNMFDTSILSLTGKASVAESWDALFHSFNQRKGRGDTGYTIGETIAIKINHVNTGSQTKTGTAIDCCAEVLFALIEQLVTAGVPQTDIIVYDGGVGTVGSYIYNLVSAVYPSVIFRSGAGTPWGEIEAEQWVDNGITYSSDIITPDADSMRVARSVWDATYLINLALLKKHENQTAVTMCGKNHFGSIKACEPIHSGINDHIKGMGTYNPLVDLGGHEEIGGKTVLYIIDGLWGSAAIAGSPVKWQSAPFNNDWPSSIFMSEDTVAIDSVGLDFINMEHTLWDNADNYLHEMALADNPQSGVFYDPEGDGVVMQSLGVHEHWNNTTDMKYSRNLGTGNGIELVTVMNVSPTQGPTALPTSTPTTGPTTIPTSVPTIGPTTVPTSTPAQTAVPTTAPTAAPTGVVNDSISIACGSSSDVGSFQPDQYYSGGSTYSNNSTVDVSQIESNPPPAALFNNERYGATSYTIPVFTAGGTYSVTFYFAETLLTASGSRMFNVSINGTTVLSNFDIYATASGQNKAIARSFVTTADGSGQIVIQFTAVTENPKVNGISINPDSNGGTLGDANGSGAIDIVDALLVAQAYVGLNPLNYYAAYADVNCSGAADIVDALLIAQMYVGLISSFQC